VTTQPKLSRLTADEFLAWAQEQPRGRFELAGGEVVAMAPERVEHARAKLAATLALRTGLLAGGLPCEAIIDGVAVRIDDLTVYEPDVIVRCGRLRAAPSTAGPSSRTTSACRASGTTSSSTSMRAPSRTTGATRRARSPR
jgi:Uma2 family endonuclease